MGCQEWLTKVRYASQGSVRPALLPKILLQGFIRWFASCGIFLGEIPLNPGVKNFPNNSCTPEFFGQFGGSDPKPLCTCKWPLDGWKSAPKTLLYPPKKRENHVISWWL